ncbi:LRR receptor-like serine/threonine-protein kinase GSO1 [Linum grandiflorum]
MLPSLPSQLINTSTLQPIPSNSSVKIYTQKNRAMAFLQFIHLLVVALLLLSGSVTARNSREELRALLEVKESLISGEPSLLTDWNRTINPNLCNWTGITCGPGRVVTGLNLSDSFLPGSIPPAIGRLRNLLHLDLSSNSLTGPIPTTLVNLSALESLLLHSNQLTGRIPDELGSLSKLRVIRIGNNYLTGEIPESLGELPELVMLGLASCSLTGVIPTKLGRLGSLEQLVLQDNQLGGPIPSELGNCSNLDSLVLANNKLNGTIPKELGGLMNLNILNLANNSLLSGEIPSQLGSLTQLDYLNLAGNQLEGLIPKSLAQLGSLHNLDLSSNQLTGRIPDQFFSGMGQLLYLALSSNNFSGGVLPRGICANKTNLVKLILSETQLTGSIPGELVKCGALEQLDLSNNALTGEIPAEIYEMVQLTHLYLHNNTLDGSIPPAIGNLTSLKEIAIYHNNFHGRIPKEIGMLADLELLYLYDNQFSGDIPEEIGNCSSLQMVDFFGNRFAGRIPATIGRLKGLSFLHLRQNELVGEIPAELGGCEQLTVLDLADNYLSGGIPDALGSLRALEQLMLYNNSLAGSVPASISNLTNLLELRLSHNRLSGRIPAEIGQLKTLMNILDLSYNNLTGSIPPAIGTLPDNKHSRLSSAVVIVLSAMTTLAALALLGLGFALFCRRRNEYLRSKSEVSCIYSSSSFGNAGMKKEIRWDDIMEATNHLSDEFVIGSGGSGTIYRAELASGEMVAVKRVPWKDELMFNKSFAREVKTLGRIRHRHLVKLVGYCCNRGAGCNLLVYEYMENGSLWDWLHKQPKKLSLDWEVRLRIAAGLAKGVEYLHHDCVPSIIHRDIKSSNLLLDADMESHLGDFGLAKTVVESYDSTTASTESTSLFAGSYGYILKATEKSDVFSMGIVLMELVTGKAPTDSVFGYDMDMVKWVEKQMGTGLSGREELIDPSLMPMLPEEESAAYRVLEIALQCTTTAPQGRPSSRQACDQLMHLLNNRKAEFQKSVVDP